MDIIGRKGFDELLMLTYIWIFYHYDIKTVCAIINDDATCGCIISVLQTHNKENFGSIESVLCCWLRN